MSPTFPNPASQTPRTALARLWASQLLRPVRRAVAQPLAVAMLALGGLALPAQAPAQSPFAAAVYVNDQAINNYEIDQYARFLDFLGAGGSDSRATARQRLIEDRLRLQEARRLGARLTPEQLADGMREFAARAELTPDEMIQRLAQVGVDRATFEDFIRAGVLWRELVNARHGGNVRITDAQIDRAQAPESVRPVTEVLLSEIFLPADPEYSEAVQQLIPQILAITSIEDFSRAARQVSASPTAEQGGRIDRWIEVAGLPEPISGPASQAPVGAIIGPLDFPGAYAFFQVRARRDTRDVPAGQIELDYRRVGLPGGRSEANLERVAQLRASTDSCADLGRIVGQVAPELPEGAVATLTQRQSALSPAIATELGRLNPGQIASNLVESSELVVLMLCARRIVADPPPTRTAIELSLYNRALEGVSEVYIQTLRSEAEIRTR